MARRMSHETRPASCSNTRSEQRHLLVELELDDSVMLAPTRCVHPRQSPTALQPSVNREARRRRRASAEDAVYVSNACDPHPHPAYDANYDDDLPSPVGANFQRPYSATRSSSARSLAAYEHAMARSQSQPGYTTYQDSATVHQAQQNRVKKLSSPYKLKRTVLSSRYPQEPVSASGGATDSRRPSSRYTAPSDSPLLLISSALRQNMQLRDQLLSQLHHEIANSSSRHHPATLQPHFVKMLNKLRSLSLSIVEMQVYFQNEVVAGQVTESAASIVNLEHEFQTYSLKMIASDADFLSCFSPLIRVFDRNGTSLSRNPFLDGLSLGSSELLLCSCNQVSSASVYVSTMSPPTASPSSAALFQLLVHKLEAFATYMRKNVPTWQILPPERIAVALLHLAELENYSNATRLLPSYLKPATSSAHRAPEWSPSSRPLAQYQRAPYLFYNSHSVSEIDCFDDEQDDFAVHPRPSFEAWSVVGPVNSLPQVRVSSEAALSRGKQSTTAPDSAHTVKSNRMPPVASVGDSGIPSVAEFKEYTALPVSAKKRKGTCSSPVGIVEVTLDKRQEKMSGTATPDTSVPVQCEVKAPDCVRIVGEEAMEPPLDQIEAECMAVQEADPSASIHKSKKAAEMIYSSCQSTESPPGTSRLNNQSAIVEPRSPVEHDQMLASPRSPDTSEIPPRRYAFSATVDDRVVERVPINEGYDQEEREHSGRDSPQDLLVQDSQPQKVTDGAQQPLSVSSLNLCDAASSTREASAPSEGGKIFDNERACTERKNIFQPTGKLQLQSSEETSEGSIFEYSSEHTLSMIASALDLLPRFGNLESAEKVSDSLPSALSNTYSCDESKKKTRFDSGNGSNTSDPVASSAWLRPPDIAGDFPAAPEEESLSLVHSLLYEVLETDDYLDEASDHPTETSDLVLEKIYSLCRDVQVAAYDMSRQHGLDPFAMFHVEDSISSPTPAEPRQSVAGQHVMGSFESPRYLERELKSLRRYFRPWRDFTLHQMEAKCQVKLKAARRCVFTFVCDVHRARIEAEIKAGVLRRNLAATRIQKNWKVHRLKMLVAKREAAFKLMHMAFKRFHLFVRVNHCRHVRENAKEKIFRWWRQRRAAIRKQSAERARIEQTQQRQMQAARGLQHFFREHSLRHRLARAEAQNQQMLFRDRLRATKARRDDEKRQKLESKRHRELELKMKVAVSDFECKWKHAESERTKLLTHHEQVVGRFQRLEGQRRRQWAESKISALIETCLLHQKIKSIEKEKEANEVQWRLTMRAKEKLELDVEKWRAKDKVQFRVLQRKLGKLEKEKASLVDRQQVLIQSHAQRLQTVRKNAARKTIQSFLEARLAAHKSNQERLKLLAAQKQIVVEREEQERMVCEDIAERERVARMERMHLETLLRQAHQDVSGLTIEQRRLVAEKDREAANAAKILAESVAAKNRITISKWIERQISISTQKANESNLKTAYAQALEREMQHRLELEQQQQALQRKREEEEHGHHIQVNLARLQRRNSQGKAQALFEKRQRERATAAICSFVESRVQSSRALKALNDSRRQAEEQQMRDFQFEQEVRKHLVNIILDTKSIVEKLARENTTAAVMTVDRLHASILYRCSRLKYLKACTLARWIQRRWRMHQVELAKRREMERIRTVKLDALRRRVHARKIQRRWRTWRHEVETHHETERAKREKCDSLHRRVCARKVQCCWRLHWVKVEKCREMKRVKIAKQDALRRLACARKIQRRWRAWAHEVEMCREAEREKREKCDALYRRACARKIQHRWCMHRMELEMQQEMERMRTVKTQVLRRRVHARKIQRRWRIWRHDIKTRRDADRVRRKKYDALCRRACSRRIQRRWRLHHAEVKVRREFERVRTMKLEALRRRVRARKIQRRWRAWRLEVKTRRDAERVRRKKCDALCRRTCARKIQRCWRRHQAEVKTRREFERVKIMKLEVLRRRIHVRKIQRRWRTWCRDVEMHRRLEKCDLFCHRACVRKIQRQWRCWRVEKERREALGKRKQELLLIIRCRVGARKILKRWRAQRAELEKVIARQERAAQIYRRACAYKIQQCWRRWQQMVRLCRDNEERRRVEQIESIRRRVLVRKIQKWWRQMLLRKERQRAMEQAALRQQEAETERRQQQAELMRAHCCARKIQRKWRQWRQWRIEVDERQKAAKKLALECLEAETAKLVQMEWMRCRACARKIQGRWRLWRVKLEECRLIAEQLAREYSQKETARLVKLDSLWCHACARVIQRHWREHWQRKMEAYQKAAVDLAIEYVVAKTAILCKADAMRRHGCAQKIQRVWRHWRILTKECRLVAERVSSECLVVGRDTVVAVTCMRRRTCARSIWRHWRQWLVQREARHRAEEGIAVSLERLRRRICGSRILNKWRKWQQNREETRIVRAAILIETVWCGFHTHEQFKILKHARHQEEIRLYELRMSGFASKIQRGWRQWFKRIAKAKRAIVKMQEDQLVRDAKERRHGFAARRIQARWAGYRCRLIYVDIRAMLYEQICVQADEFDLNYLEGANSSFERDEKHQDESERQHHAFQLGIRLGLQQWACHQLPHIFSSAINAAAVRENAARIMQQLYRSFLARQRQCFVHRALNDLHRSSLGNKRHSQIRLYFANGRAWMTSNNQSTCGCRLRFDAVMTQKLLHVFDPAAHTAAELNEALEDLAMDVQPIFDNAGRDLLLKGTLGFIDVDEMDLPNFCMLTRKMGRIRSMHKRKRLQPERPIVARAHSLTSSQQEFEKLTIFDAVETASVDDARFLLANGADLAALEPSTGRNALHLLAFCSETFRLRLEMLRFLVLEAHLDVNAVDAHGDPPLFMFAACGHLELMKTLIEYGADWTLTNKKEQNVLHRACDVDQVEVCGYLHEKFGSVADPDGKLDRTLHMANLSGRSPLHIVAEKGFVECANQILSTANDEASKWLLSQRDRAGQTPLQVAIVNGHSDLVALLLKQDDAGANYCDQLQRFPVHLAVDAIHGADVISLLASHGAVLNAVDERGDTALHWAAFSGRLAVIQVLLNLGADPSVRNSDWELPAHVGASYGHLECVRVLLDAQKQFPGISSDDDILILEAKLEQHQASGKSYYCYKVPSPTASMIRSSVASSSFSGDANNKVEYWDELHQEVQLVEESGNFSSEDDDFLNHDEYEEDEEF